ncbi:hypothetical protein [Amycolatopsis tolypomycina]|uniref:hypothetical protein n=1 Tax=Amycolatopsis tolypomycina TaxID=208445 RepID=UPI0033A068DC
MFAEVEQLDPSGDMAELATHPSLTDEAVLARWSELPPLSRVLYGKLRRLHEEGVFRRRTNAQEVPTHSTLATAMERGLAELAAGDKIR